MDHLTRVIRKKKKKRKKSQVYDYTRVNKEKKFNQMR